MYDVRIYIYIYDLDSTNISIYIYIYIPTSYMRLPSKLLSATLQYDTYPHKVKKCINVNHRKRVSEHRFFFCSLSQALRVYGGIHTHTRSCLMNI